MTGEPPPGVRYVRDVSPADLGARVVLRRALPGGGLSDVLGELLSWAGGTLVVGTRSGPVAVPEADVRALKRVPPPPPRRPR